MTPEGTLKIFRDGEMFLSCFDSCLRLWRAVLQPVFVAADVALRRSDWDRDWDQIWLEVLQEGGHC